jgi:hypothetical protein
MQGGGAYGRAKPFLTSDGKAAATELDLVAAWLRRGSALSVFQSVFQCRDAKNTAIAQREESNKAVIRNYHEDRTRDSYLTNGIIVYLRDA